MAETNSEQTTTTTTNADDLEHSEHFENDDDYDDVDDDDQIDLPDGHNTGFTGFSTSNADHSAKTDCNDENNVSSEWSDNDGYEVEYADDDNEYDICDDDNVSDTTTVDDAIYRQFFEQLIEAKKLSVLKQQNAQFFPATRRYLASSFVNREKMFNKRMQTNLLYIAKCIVDGKIRLRIPEVDKEFMLDILDRSTPKEDVRLYLLEDRRLHLYFRKALQLIEQQQQGQKQNGGQRTKTNNDRQRKVQRPNGSVTGNNATSKNSRRFNSNTGGGRTSGESERNDEIC